MTCEHTEPKKRDTKGRIYCPKCRRAHNGWQLVPRYNGFDGFSPYTRLVDPAPGQHKGATRL